MKNKETLKKSTKQHDQALSAVNKIVNGELRKIAKSPLYQNVENEVKAEIAAKNAKAQLQKKFKKLPGNIAKLLKESVAIKMDQVSIASRLTSAAAVGEMEGGPVGAIARAAEQLDFEAPKKKSKKKKPAVKKVKKSPVKKRKK